MTMRHRVLPLLAFVLVAICPSCFETAPIEGALCSKSRRCPDDYLCQGARCHAGSPYVQSLLCEGDADCQEGTHCHPTDGLCVQCHAPEHCLTGLCTPQNSCTTCAADTDCVETGRCNSYGYCAACLSDEHCPVGSSCLPGLGQCVAPQEDRREGRRSVREGRSMEGP